MKREKNDALHKLIRDAVPPVRDEGLRQDLWPAMQARLNSATNEAQEAVPWYDWALAAALAAFAVFVPVSIPVLLYYL